MEATRHHASPQGLGQHDSALHSRTCPQCQRNFATEQALTQHQKAKGHYHHCGDCNRSFPSAALLREHLTASQHSSEFRCCDCNRNFTSSKALRDHLRDKVHGVPKRLRERRSGPCDCPTCHRTFRTAEALQQHLNSLVHRPLSDLACIAHSSCKSRFRSPSALLHHLESGACRSGINRQKINMLVLAKDTDRIITTPPQRTALPELDTAQRPRVDDDGDTTVASSDVLILTPSSTVTSPHSSTPGWATPQSGSSFGSVAVSSQSRRCPLCPPRRRAFATEQGLRDHMASPAHDPPIVHCPLALLATKGKSGAPAQTQKGLVKTFTTVSGLAQHLESSACIGGLKSFWKATEYLEMMMVRWGFKVRLTIRSESPDREKMGT